MKFSIDHMQIWINERIGLRHIPSKETTHHIVRKWCGGFFEFLKRLALLSVLWAAGQQTPWIEVLYYVGLAALVLPIGTWMEQWEADFKTRNPTHYRPDLGEEMPAQIPIPPELPPVWKHSTAFTVFSSIIAFWLLNIAIGVFVSSLAEKLSSLKH